MRGVRFVELDASRRVTRHAVDQVNNNLTAQLMWCATHVEPVWVYNDLSFQCPHETCVGWDSDSGHEIVPPPWENPCVPPVRLLVRPRQPPHADEVRSAAPPRALGCVSAGRPTDHPDPNGDTTMSTTPDPSPILEQARPTITPGDLIRASVSFLASCIACGEGWSEHVAQAVRNAETGVAALEGREE